MKLYPNGILVQELIAPTNYISAINYRGILAYCNFPLMFLNNNECKRISNRVPNLLCQDGTYIELNFISNIDLAIEYNVLCKKNGISVRNLFIESRYPEERWEGKIPDTTVLGYEYSTIPFDCQIITDLDWYKPFRGFYPLLNGNGLFNSYEDALKFKQAYERSAAINKVGDDNPDSYIFKISELKL